MLSLYIYWLRNGDFHGFPIMDVDNAQLILESITYHMIINQHFFLHTASLNAKNSRVVIKMIREYRGGRESP